MSDAIIRDLLRSRDNLQDRVARTKDFILAMDTIPHNVALMTGQYGTGKVYIDRQLAAEIATGRLEGLENELASVNAKVEAINTLLAN